MTTSRLLLFSLLGAAAVGGGCATQEPPVTKTSKSVSEIDAQIKQVQADPKIPAQAKQSVLAGLQKERDAAGGAATGAGK